MKTGKALIMVISCVVDKLVNQNDEMHYDNRITKFHSQQIPGIRVADYLSRLKEYLKCSNECFLISLIYIDRIIQSHQFIVNSYNVHRLLLASLRLANKYTDDQFFNNAYFAQIGGISGCEMNDLEKEFLFLLNFDLYVSLEDYVLYYNQLVFHVEGSDGCSKCLKYLKSSYHCKTN